MIRDWVFATGSQVFGPLVRTVRVHPWYTHEHLHFQPTGDQPYGQIDFDIDLSPDLSVSVGWNGQEIDDDKSVASQSGGTTVAKDSGKAGRACP
jgi:hypothetical protein